MNELVLTDSSEDDEPPLHRSTKRKSTAKTEPNQAQQGDSGTII